MFFSELRQEDTNFVVPLFSYVLTGNMTCLLRLVARARAVSSLATSIYVDSYKETRVLVLNFVLYGDL